ncbi:esterase family protein [Mycolicibacterium moriokaense]|nr:esterase family protein [Mycolicibacterium moriokaense]
MACVTTVLAAGVAQADEYRHGLSLLHGWLPIAVQAVAAAALVPAIGWRTRRWRLLWLPIALVVGVVVALWARWFIDSQGMAGDPAPRSLMVWIGVSGLAIAVAILGWRGAAWWRRAVSILAIPLCLLSAGVAVNLWVGYFRTVQLAWNELTAGPLPDQTDMETVTAMKQKGDVPPHGALVSVDIPDDASHFKHRSELVYLPPAWFAADAPKLPVVMMIAGEFNTPSDWPRTGDAIAPIDAFAADHGGNAPVFVFVDVGGSFNNDTECVNGPRGNVADHLTRDVPPFVASTFGVEPDHWGVVGWSMGGTCAVDLTVMNPELFTSFVDIAGDNGPNAGTRQQTIDRIFGGDVNAWASYDPTTAIDKHGPYRDVSGWFAISSDKPTQHTGGYGNPGGTGLGGQDAAMMPGDETEAANSLCGLGRANGITCAVVASPGKHDWPFASDVFTASLPWLAGQVGTPGVPKIPLPDHRDGALSAGSG